VHGLAVLRGNIALDGCVVKTAGVDDSLLVFAIWIMVGFAVLSAFGLEQARTLEGETVVLDALVKNTLFVAMVISAYLFFGFFWTNSGQTLGMQAWRIRVVRTDAKGVASGIGFFQALDQLTAAVQGSSRMNMQRGIGEMDALQNGLTLALAQVGTDMNVADAQTAVLEETRLSLKTTLSNIEDLDYAEAIGQMNKQMLSLEAAQSSFGKISKLNLFNYLN
jgi:flagellin-like hook-associated protein FlgL